MTAGTGLGLFVARKIAIAHGGNLELDSEPSGDSNVAFRMTIPVPEREQPESRLPESELSESELAESELPESELAESELPESELAESELDELRENL